MTFNESFCDDALYYNTLKNTVFTRERIRFEDNITMGFGIHGLKVWNELVRVRTVPSGGLL